MRSDIEMHVSFNGTHMDEAVAASDRMAEVVPRAKFHIWFGAEEGAETDTGFSPGRQLSEQALLHHVRCLKPDVALSLSPFEGDTVRLSPFAPPRSFDCPTAAIFYDAIPFRFPDFYLPTPGFRSAYQRRLDSLKSFDVLLAISDYAKGEAEELLPGQEVVNISCGLSPDFASRKNGAIVKSVETLMGVGGPTLLYVGGFDRRKNLKRAVKAISRLEAPLREELRFVIVGDKQAAEIEELKTLWVTHGLPYDHLVFFGFANDDELVSLNRCATAIIQPSLMEGFGLTALEAMSCGTPVIVSNGGALPEVVGSPDVTFDAEDTEDMARKIAWVMKRGKDVEKLVEIGRERAKSFSWEDTATRTSRTLDELVAKHRPVDRPIQQLRVEALQAVKDFKVAPQDTAGVMSAAEPVNLAEPRLFVDVTSTARVDHKTGIQRVVNNIARFLPAACKSAGLAEPILIGSDAPLAFFPVELGNSRDWDAQRESRITFGARDTIIMLDSSWEFHALHRDILRVARLRGARIVSVLYDMVPLNVSGFCHEGMPGVFAAWFKNALEYSTDFICISRTVADELADTLEAINFPRKMSLRFWHLGADFSAPPGVREKSNALTIDRSTFLSVGTLEPRKGHEVQINAFEKLWEQGVDASLVIVGRQGWDVDALIERIVGHKEYGKRLFWKPGLDDSQLAHLYSRSAAVIASSYAEGFGLPIVEAGHFGVPVIAGDLAVFKEVAEGRQDVHFFQTGNSDSLVSEIQSLMDKAEDTHEVLPAKTWKTSAAEFLSSIMSLPAYRTHVPRDGGGIGKSQLGQTAMTDRVDVDASHHVSLKLISQPTISKVNDCVSILIRVTNETGAILSSETATPGKHSVMFNSVCLNESRDFLDDRIRQKPLVFILAPGQSQIYRFDVPRSDIDAGAVNLLVAVMQEGQGLLGRPLEIDFASRLSRDEFDPLQVMRDGLLRAELPTD
ncbi:MAG: glycosyltransferase family 1 protein [Hyphomonas sp.]|jgi:glycosyltransferase involved in cell wall biosynthesis